MKKNVAILYLDWHYRDKFLALWDAWKNLLKFGLEYFSIPFLLKTLFSYWKNYHDYYRKFDFKYNFSVFTFNTVSRLIGAFVRFWVIVVGIISEIFIFIGGAIFLFIWLFLPFLPLVLIIFSLKILI